MNPNTYQKLANRTNDNLCEYRIMNRLLEGDENGFNVASLLNGCLGLAGESGETLDLVKKWLFHEKEIDIVHLKKELGDVMWYIALICTSMGFDLEEILEMNIDKLKNRYPDGFDVEKANNRKDDDI